jgi:PAT family beta-lactamase induction signal transducer AmpG
VTDYGRNHDADKTGMTGWRRSLAVYTDRRVLLILALGFASGLPLLLTFSTLSAWLATAGVRRAAIGAFALVGTPYAFKFVWSPLIDRLPPPLPLGRRRGWGITIQIALIAAILALGMSDPKRHLALMGVLALLVAFLSASQDIVIDAWRVEILPLDLQWLGAGMIQTGYRVAMLVSGAGALVIAAPALAGSQPTQPWRRCWSWECSCSCSARSPAWRRRLFILPRRLGTLAARTGLAVGSRPQ